MEGSGAGWLSLAITAAVAVGILLKKQPASSATPEPRITDHSPEEISPATLPAYFDESVCLPLTVDLLITYRDAYDNVTERLITTRGFQYIGDDGLIVAHCHLRRAKRSFRHVRIASASDPATGLPIADLRGWLSGKFLATPAGQVHELMQRNWPALNCLHFLAKADNAFRAKEKEAIRQFLAVVSGAPQCVISEAISEMTKWPPRSLSSFREYLKPLASETAKYREHLASTARAITFSDKNQNATEITALSEIEQALTQEDQAGNFSP